MRKLLLLLAIFYPLLIAILYLTVPGKTSASKSISGKEDDKIISALPESIPAGTVEITEKPESTPASAVIITPVKSAKPLPSLEKIDDSATDEVKVQGESTFEVGSVQEYIMSEINEYRASHGLSRVTTNRETCSFANIRAVEISNNFNHDGFTNRVADSTLPYPSRSEATENIAMYTDYRDVVSAWIKSPLHAENMRKNTPYVCVAQSGNYYAYEGWRP